MLESPACPVCRATAWKVIGQRTYSTSQIPQLSEYCRARYKVLFDLWLPGCDSVTLRNSVCGMCGFVTNLPRPEERDIDAKYRQLEDSNLNGGVSGIAEIDAVRSVTIFNELRARLPSPATVMDFGGGDGRLMRTFAESGHRCLLVDYNVTTVPFVTKIADTLRDIPSTLIVDAIVCSHVLEHVADPVAVIRELLSRIGPMGYLFVEVPMEIWRKPPLHDEPVTHVNFFAAGSLRRCLEEAGAEVVRCRHAASMHPTGRMLPVVRALARHGTPSMRVSEGVNEVRKLLNPGWLQKIERRWIMRDYPWKRLTEKLFTLGCAKQRKAMNQQ